MRKLIILALAGALALAGLPADAWIAQKAAGVPAGNPAQVLITSTQGTTFGSVDRFWPVGYSSATIATTDSPFTVFASPGAITSIRMALSVAPGGATTRTLTLNKNGSATAFTCTLTGAATSNVCTGSVSFAAGDYASWKTSVTGSPASAMGSMTALFVPTTANDWQIFAQGQAFSTSATQAVQIGVAAAAAAVSATANDTFPDGGTIDQLYAVSNAPGAGTSYAYTVDKNGSVTTATCSIANTATSCNDTAHSFTIAGPGANTPSDNLMFQGVPTSTPASATTGFGARYRPTTTASFPLLQARSGTSTSGAANFYQITGGLQSGGASTEAQAQGVSEAMTITKIAARVVTAPGVGNSRTFVLRKNGADANTGSGTLNCTITGTNTGCNATGSVTIAAGDLINSSDTQSGAAASTTVSIGYLANR